MKATHRIFLLILVSILGIFSGSINASAGFHIHKMKAGIINSTTDSCTVVKEANSSNFGMQDSHKSDRALKKEYSLKKGFLAYAAIACGLLGIIIGSLNTVFLMYILGLAGIITGKLGLKRYKHSKILTALCYVGIVLCAIAMLYATMPILFLI